METREQTAVEDVEQEAFERGLRNVLQAPAPWLVEARALTPLSVNGRITQGYVQLAGQFQALLDPDFEPGGKSRVRPSWFAFAPHASQEAGKGMLGALLARTILDAAQGQPAPTLAHALDRAGLGGPPRLVAERVGGTLRWLGLSHDVAAALGTLVGATNLDALVDPRTFWAVICRLARLVREAPGPTPLERAEAVARTLERLLVEGNVAIFEDVAGAGRAYLAWRAEAGGDGVTAAQVVEGFRLAGALPEDARRAWQWAQGAEASRAEGLAQALPGVGGQSLVVAGFALYEEARTLQDVGAREARVALGNAFIAWREQHDAVQPSFTPAFRRQDEVPRPALMQALTPVLRLQLGATAWELSAWAQTRKDRDGNPLTSRSTEYNWALFADRWPAILDAFAQGYRSPEALWAPSPAPTLLPSAHVPEHQAPLQLRATRHR